MPPKARLHDKNGKKKAFPKKPETSVRLIPQPTTSTDDMDSAVSDNQRNFEVELCWCIQQLEITLESKKLNPKQAQESMKILNVLKNNSQPTVRKRQLMRLHFGDYRAKMSTEEKKAKQVNKRISFSDGASTSKSTFLRKSAALTMGDTPFKFNFEVPTDDPKKTTEQETVTGFSTDTTNVNINNTDVKKHNTLNYLFNGESFKFNFNVD